LKYQKLQQLQPKNQKGGMKGNNCNTTNTIMRDMMSMQPNQYQSAFMPIFFNHIVKEIKEQLYHQLFNVSNNVEMEEIVLNLKEILNIFNIKFINLCKSDKSVNDYCNTDMSLIQKGDNFSILYKLSKLQTMSDKKFDNLKSTSFPPYIKLFEKYRKTPYEGITLMDVMKLMNDYINYEDNDGDTPLNNTVFSNNIVLFKLLIENGADLNIQNKHGNTPLHYAVQAKLIFAKILIHYLVAQNADLNIQNNYGDTPLHYAVQSTVQAKLVLAKILIHYLVAQNADLNIQNNYRETPLHIAIKINNNEIVKLLKEYIE